MCRFVSLFFICCFVVLCICCNSKTLITIANSATSNVVVLVNEKDSQLVSIIEEDLDQFLNKINLQNCNKFFIEDRLIIEGYSSKINDYIVINNNKINIQISVCDNRCLIGSPVIKNSFWKKYV